MSAGVQTASRLPRYPPCPHGQRGGVLLLTALTLASLIAAALYTSARVLSLEHRAVAHETAGFYALSAAEDGLSELQRLLVRHPVAGNPVAGNPVAGNPVAGNPVAGNPASVWRSCSRLPAVWEGSPLPGLCRHGREWWRAPAEPGRLRTLIRRRGDHTAELIALSEARRTPAQRAVQLRLQPTDLLRAEPSTPLLAAGPVILHGQGSLVVADDYPAGSADQAILLACRARDFFDANSSYEKTVPIRSALRLCRRCRCAKGSATLGLDRAAATGPLLPILFGEFADDWEQLRGFAELRPDCASLPDDAGFLWIEGDCALSGASELGSSTAPVLLVVQGDLSLQTRAALFGIALIIDDTAHARLGADAQIYGALAADASLHLHGEGYRLIGSAELNRRLRRRLQQWLPVPGSWTDF